MADLSLYIILILGFTFVCASILWFAMDLRKTKGLLRKAETEKNELRSIISDAEIMVNELNSFSNYLLEKIDQKNSEAGLILDRLDETIYNINQPADNPEASIADRVDPESDRTDTAAAGNGWADISAAENVGEDSADAENVGEDSAVEENVGTAVAAAESGGADPANQVDGEPIITSQRVKLSRRRFISGFNGRNNGRVKNAAILTEDAGIRDIRDMSDASDISVNTETRETAAPLIMFPKNDQPKHIARTNERRGAVLSRNAKYSEALRLYEEGMDETEIARTLNIGRGEVALILGLRVGGVV